MPEKKSLRTSLRQNLRTNLSNGKLKSKRLKPGRIVNETLNFSEQFFPARPRQFIKKASKLTPTSLVDAARKIGRPVAANKNYVRWLREESMLYNANQIAKAYSGSGRMWQNPFARPRPRSAVKQASVWYTAYPLSLVTKPRESILSTLADESLWTAFEQIGIDGLHTGPMKLAGGLNGWDATPSIDGHFDRISNHIDGMFGDEADFKRMTEVAARHGGIVIDDVVPGHTGKGADFRLAEMKAGDYPGVYHMVEIQPGDWYLLPDVPKGKDSANISPEAEAELKIMGYIVGKLSRVIFYEPGVKETNWSATRVVKGVDGVKRRWVYLHYFKEGQPSINWLDPTFAGMKLVIGDALHSLGELGSRGLRLDANGFLGIEKSSETDTAWSEGHPLSGAANQLISSMVRKVRGFTFQELNLSFEHMKTMSELGADLSYDFINRPAYHHALAVGDTEFLRMTLRTAASLGIDPASLIHALQNHDDLTYELVHYWTVHKDDVYELGGKKLTGYELRLKIRKELADRIAGKAAPYNLLFTENGIACTTTSAIAAILGHKDLDGLKPEDTAEIMKVHLLLAMFNAMQPGVFALSGWDLCGSLTLEADSVKDLMADGDTRWINRGSYDLLGVNPDARQSTAGMPLARNLYGTLTQQLADPDSFANQLKRLLEVRDRYGIAVSHQIDIPDVPHKGLLAMVHRLGGDYDGKLQMTILNFSGQTVKGTITSESLPPGAEVYDMFAKEARSSIYETGGVGVALEPYQGLSLLIG